MYCLTDIILIKEDDHEIKEFKGNLTDLESKLRKQVKLRKPKLIKTSMFRVCFIVATIVQGMKIHETL